MTDAESKQRSLADLLNRYRYLGVAIALVGGAALLLVILKDVIFRGGGETTLGLNSFIAIAAVGLLIIFAIVVDARAKNRALMERADKLGEMAKRMYATVEELNVSNEELERANLQADFSSQAKSIFLSDLSNEINAPIIAILGDALKLRGNQDLSAAQRKSVDNLALNGEILAAIIDDVVEIARMEAGRVELTAADFELGDFMAELRADSQRNASERGIGLDLDISPHGFGKVNGDAGLLRRVLEFLLANAIDTNESGAVRFSLSRAGEDIYAFEVRDRGAVLSAEALADIFEPFHKMDGDRIKGTTGLGLAIAEKRIALMGSELKIHSQAGEGCIFSFQVRLPAAAD